MDCGENVHSGDIERAPVMVALGSASAGIGSPGNRHRSMKSSCAAERSSSCEACHFAMNSREVTVGFSACRVALLAARSTAPPSGAYVQCSSFARPKASP